MLAVVQFAAPALLVGAAAAALPFVIHLLLRPRPRRVWFPPVTFLRPALASGQRAQRLRNLWLLLLRALLLAAIALLLAGPTCAPTAATPDMEEPVACMLVVDDSWSMHYQVDGETTLLDRARAEALAFTRSAAHWPQPSTLGLIWADPERSVVELTTEYATVRSRLREADTRTPHAVPLNHALREAGRLLQAARQPARRLVVFTDQAAHAWGNVAPGLLTGIDNLTVRVHSVVPQRRTNIALTAGSGPRGLHAENLPVPIRATLAAAGLDATCFLVVRDGPRVVERFGPLEVSADTTRDMSLVLPPRPQGVHALTLDVEPTDRLPFDQKRYVVFQTTERPVAWLVTPADPDADLTALLLRNLLAPETLEPEHQLVTFRHVLPTELGDGPADERGADDRRRGGARDPDLIVITVGIELNEAARQQVRRAAERGATVLLLPGSREGATDWPGLRRLLARSVRRVESLGAVTSFSWEAGLAFAERSAELDELTRIAVRRRVELAGLEDGVTVEARYADGIPAIVSSRRGRGRFLLLTTSPDPQWSELGMRAAGLLTWLHELLRESLGPPDAVATFAVGEATRHSFPALPGRGVVRVFSLTDEGDTSISVRLANGEPTPGWPTQRPGIYAIRAGHRDNSEPLYAVNWPAEESDSTAIVADRLEALLGVADVALEGAGAAGEQAELTLFARLTGLRDAARLLPFVLLALVLAELLLASRLRPLGGRE